MAKAFENIKMSQSIDYESTLSAPTEPEVVKNVPTTFPNGNGISNGSSTTGNGSNGNYQGVYSTFPMTFSQPANNQNANNPFSNGVKNAFDCDEVRQMQKELGSEVSFLLFSSDYY